MITEQLAKEIDSFVARMSEHCDSVRIFITKQDGTNTKSYTKGGGNFYAQRGQVLEWIEIQKQCERNQVLPKASDTE